MTEVLTVQEAAARAKVSDKTIYKALDRFEHGEPGGLTGSKVGSVWRIFADDLEAWLRSLRPQAREPRPRRSGPQRAQRGSLRALRQVHEGGHP